MFLLRKDYSAIIIEIIIAVITVIFIVSRDSYFITIPSPLNISFPISKGYVS